MTKQKSYLPVDPDFFDRVEEVSKLNQIIDINFFNAEDKVDGTKDTVLGFFSDDGFEQFLKLENHPPIRLDRIITLKGLPGPAFDEYDRYALECLTCMGGNEPQA